MEQRKAEIDAAFADLCSPRRTFTNLVGERYAGCQFDGFECSEPCGAAKQKAVESCQRIANSIEAVVGRGQSVVLVGPVGTGKDHLLACMLRPAVKAAITCERVNGADLAGHCRDLIGGRSTERDFLDRWSRVALLAISDPDGSREKVSEFYGEWLYRIVDARYRESKSVWVTLNAASDAEAARKIGDRTWDRIQHRAIVVKTNWPTHRRPAGVVN